MSFSPERSALRGLGSSGVVLYHSWSFLLVAGMVPAALVPWLIPAVGQVGWMGVALFLTLSIYLLMGSLDAKAALLPYFRRRVVRIWPLYFAVLLLVWWFLTDRSLTTLAWNASFLAAFDPAHALRLVGVWSPSYVVWTLQLEEWAYLCFPLLHRLGHRARLGTGAALVVASAAVMASGSADYFTPWPWLACYGLGLLAYETRADWGRLGVWTHAGVPLAAFLGWPWGLLLGGPFAAWLIAYPPAALRRVALVAVGECSYALYLVHLALLDELGIPGALLAYPVAWGAESLQRGREMRRRLARALPTHLSGPELGAARPATPEF
jgi:peptidoglycan/LPS O-acetylase OafA/YrhL